jgi:uncharacterized protein YerC
LTWEAVREIREERYRQKVYAAKFGVSVSTISKVQQGLAWRADPAAVDDEDDDIDSLFSWLIQT